MSYTVNLGCWGSIFAVPTDIVDKYLKIAGSAQLKVLLFILRHSGEQFEIDLIAKYLNMETFDVKDCIEFWLSFNVISVNNNVITPAQSKPAAALDVNTQPALYQRETIRQPNVKPTVPTVPTAQTVQSAAKAAPVKRSEAQPADSMPENNIVSTVKNDSSIITENRNNSQSFSIASKTESAKPEFPPKSIPEKPSETVMARPLRPDPVYVAKRISEDKEIAALLDEAQYILGRPVSPNENAGMIMMHDNDGLPCEVILMLLTYGASNQKGMRQIEAMGAAWAREGILTLEQADEKIRELEESKEAYRKVQSILGLEFRKPSQKEEENYSRWLNEWKFSDDMIKEAYDICVNSKGKYIPNYVNTVLQKWYEHGIRTVEQVKDERSRQTQKNYNNSNSNDNGRSSSFDIKDLSGLSMFND